MLAGALHKIETARGRNAAALTVLAGAISVFGHAPFFIWPLFLLCMGGLMLRLDGLAGGERSGRAAFWAGYAFGFGYFLASLYWIASAFLTRGGFYVFLAPFGALLLPAGLALFWGFAGWLYVRFKSAGPLRAVLFAVIFFITEYLRGHILSGFPWNLPGYIWEAGGAVSQSASLFGIYGLTFLTLMLAAGVGAAFKPGNGRWGPPLASLLIFCGLFTHGQLRLSNAQVTYVEGPKIRVVQAQMKQLTKYDPDYYSDVITKYLDLSVTAPTQGLTHIIWPEGAIPGFALEDPGFMAAIDETFDSGPTLLMGATRREKVPGGDFRTVLKYYNSLAALTPTGTGEPDITALYNKSKLVPFGEYFPGNALIKSWNIPGLTAATSSFNHGERELTTLPGLPKTSVQICYEAIFAGFTPKPANGEVRASWILTVSNDSWFGKSTGPHQHFNQVQYRAIEEGLPIVRSASSGISGFIDPYGRKLLTRGIDDSGVIDSALPHPIPTPPYARLRR